jgi:hypothetical protein
MDSRGVAFFLYNCIMQAFAPASKSSLVVTFHALSES